MSLTLITFAVILIFVAFVYLLYCVNPNNDSALAKIRHFILYSVVAKIQKGGDLVFGSRFSGTFRWLVNYLFFTNNSIVMVCYLFIGPGCYILYVGQVIIPYFRYISTTNLIIGNLVSWAAFYMYHKAYSTNPGIITAQNSEKYVSRFSQYGDRYLNIPNQICSTCNITKLNKKTSSIEALQALQRLCF
jgi:hypothetical protein